MDSATGDGINIFLLSRIYLKVIIRISAGITRKNTL